MPLYVLAAVMLWLAAVSSALAGGLRVESLVVRGGMSGSSPIGEEQRIYFQQADVGATSRLPWEWEAGGDWVLGSRILGSVGVLRGEEETNGIVTLVPLNVTLGRKDKLLSIDMGVGGALLTDNKFGQQKFGGAFQFVWTFGVTSRLAGPLGLGYHFQHYSDATLYGSDSRGVDLHLFELIYWFEPRK
ncbi:acyloxyacyl hydrolase [Petrachloros mirabilis]